MQLLRLVVHFALVVSFSFFVVSVSAPWLCLGMHEMDEFLQSQLLLAALTITTRMLRVGGTFVAKIFRGEASPVLLAHLYALFHEVYCTKPASSRGSSLEAFVVAKNFYRVDGLGGTQAVGRQQALAKLLELGDLSYWDEDHTEQPNNAQRQTQIEKQIK
eukprot:GHVT01094794.1.p1 GENE.GHVT01094794.1~~GHVT01094794.1.p1  ORF type:complete len:160 (+),score=32.25 GHVT01094794.1:190-669(+)